MEIANSNKDGNNNNGPIDFDKKSTIKFDLKTLLLPIMQKNRRSFFVALVLIFLHFIFLFSLQIRSTEFPFSKGLMPSIHFVLSKFNLILLIEDVDLRIYILAIFLSFNSLYIFSMIILGFLGELPRKHPFRLILTKLHVVCFQIYIWIFLIPCTQLSAFFINSDKSMSIKVLGLINVAFVVLISNFIEYYHVNINFKYEDNLDSRTDSLDQIMINVKIVVVMIAGIGFHADYFLLAMYLFYIIDYLKKINFYLERVSQFYFCCLLYVTFSSLVYLSFYNSILDLKNFDVSYLLMFGGSVILKTTLHARSFLIVHKLKLINKYGIRTKADFDIYIRECYQNLKNFRNNLDSKILFLSFFSIHQNSCRLPYCDCKGIRLTSEAGFTKSKKVFKRVVESYFIVYLETVQPSDFEDVFLIYCSFLANILKIPSKALNLLLINQKKITSMKNQILSSILIKKSKKSLEKQLLNNDQYSQSFSTVITFDYQVRLLERNLRKLIGKQIQILGTLMNENDGKSVALDKFMKIGKEIFNEIESTKNIIRKLFDKNLNHSRLIQLTTLVIKYLSEDLAFRNFYKQLNIKRINDKIIKRKKDGDDKIDIFDKDAGVVFLTLSKGLGNIKKFSKTFPKVFNCDEFEMKKQNIKHFMPICFGVSHDKILMNFIKTGKPSLLTTKNNNLYGISKENYLIHLNLIIRLDTFFVKDFFVGAYVKSLKNATSKTILIDIHGNFINCSKEVSNVLNFNDVLPENQHKISMILLIPDILERLLPYNYEEILLRRNTNFKLKGFLLCPNEISNETFEKVSIKDEIFGSFNDFKESTDPDLFFQELRKKVLIKLSEINPQEYTFYRIHFTLVVQNFSNNFVNVRLIELLEIFEIKDVHLKVQYINKKIGRIKEMFKKEAGLLAEELQLPNLDDKNPPNREISRTSSFHKKEENKQMISSNPSLNQSIDRSEEKEKIEKQAYNLFPPDVELGDSYLSVTNRSDLDKKVSEMNQVISEIKGSSIQQSSLGKTFPHNLLDVEESNARKGTNASGSENSNSQLLIPSGGAVMNSQYNTNGGLDKLSTIEQSESELTVENDQDFEEKISLISNNIQVNSSDDESIGGPDGTATHAGSQASRVSSHASGDGKKSAIDLLLKIGVKKIEYLKFIIVFIFFLFLGIPILFFVLNQNESLKLETTLKNSGNFHDQLSPLCVLVRDSTLFKFKNSEIILLGHEELDSLMEEAKDSIDFNNNLLLKAYKNGIAKADSNVDFIYSKFLNISLHNITLYTDVINSLETIPIKILPSNLYQLTVNVPQAILFFLVAANHLHNQYYLNNLLAEDSYNFIFFLRENILDFTKVMLEVFDENKGKISGSVNFITSLNLIFFLIIIFGIAFALIQIVWIGIKSKYKANKFCALFFHFQELELEERSTKLKGLLDRYFDGKNRYVVSEVSNLTKTDSKKSGGGILHLSMFGTDKISLLKSNDHHKRNYRRSNSIKQIKGKKFQEFLIFFLFGGLVISTGLIGIFLSNYISNDKFAKNVIDITKDLESVETYVISLHIQYSVNSILLGVYDEPPARKKSILEKADYLLEDIEKMQSIITDLSYLFKITDSDRILTQLKFDFFTKDICELYNIIKVNINSQVETVRLIAGRLKEISFCQRLLKGILTKGSTSYAFELTEIFKQWQTYLRERDFTVGNTMSIIQTKEFMDINFALPYVYALGIFDILEMLDRSINYFVSYRDERVTWIVCTLIIISLCFSFPAFQLINYLKKDSEESFNLLRIFPYLMITNNKMLENKISRISRMQKI